MSQSGYSGLQCRPEAEQKIMVHVDGIDRIGNNKSESWSRCTDEFLEDLAVLAHPRPSPMRINACIGS